ncbi:Hvo_1808 family surface protein [Halobaculum sp. MBLA0147]|uniref:Hvo_1808 family surface protein n=1 Tax=Halobaculum sp. MBLA0147 TaxID=3079934 RepID=UPI0035258CA1
MRALVPVVVVLVAVATVPGVATAASGGVSVASSGSDTVDRLDGERVATESGGAATFEATAAPQRPDPENDTIGWEAGYWYDDPLPTVDASDGFNQTELDKVVARAMARVERVRKLEFERTVPVELLGRDTYRERYASGPDENTSEAFRQFDNAKFEALFLINESTDSLETQSTNRGASVGGFYSPSQDRIVVVSENTTQPKLSEVTLSQELFHALQDQQFDLSALNYSTREKHNAADGIVEGDGNLVDRLYQRRCEAEWDCFEDTSNGSGSSGGGLANIGVYFVKFQPYSDGPTFVSQLKREGGWAAVNAAYENPPASTSAVISPEEYGEEEPKTVRLADRTGDDWQRVRPPGRVDYAEVGQAGIASMFAYPLYAAESGEQPPRIVGPREWLNYTASGELSDTDPLNYGFAAAEGWAGDRMHVYRDADNETGYVWRIAWESPEEAAEFRDAYATLVEFWGGEAVGESTYRISEGGFADAIHVAVSGDTVTITNAPTVSELSAVRSGVSVSTDGTDGESTATPDDGGEGADDTDGTDGTDGESTATPAEGADGSAGDDPATTAPVPGFGASVAVLALAAALVGLLVRRRR